MYSNELSLTWDSLIHLTYFESLRCIQMNKSDLGFDGLPCVTLHISINNFLKKKGKPINLDITNITCILQKHFFFLEYHHQMFFLLSTHVNKLVLFLESTLVGSDTNPVDTSLL